LEKTNDVVRLQALIDRRKVIITEDTVRQALRLDDADSINYLPNEEIFAELARMGYEKQVHDDVANAAENEDVANEISVEPTTPLSTPAPTPPPQQELIPSPSQEVGKEEKVESFRIQEIEEGKIVELDANEDISLETVDAEDADVQGRFPLPESQAQVYHLDLEHAQKVLSMQKTNEAEPAEVKEVIKVVTAAKLMIEVVTTTAATTITAAPLPKASASRRRRGMIIQDPKEVATASEKKGKQEIEEEERKESKRKSESSDQKVAKKQRIDEEVEELKIHLQIKSQELEAIRTCGVQVITFTTTQMILLVERRYHLTRFTLEQMLNNVRLEVEEESEVSLELMRFVRRQQQEGYKPE
nr:hypothetical protein [Tanacetum cinerariifolium]